MYLYPFLNTQSKSRPFEYLRLTSLGVIGALVKVDDTEVISFLLSTEIIPLCLRIMETGSELSKTVATFIVQKVLLEDGKVMELEISLDYLTLSNYFPLGSLKKRTLSFFLLATVGLNYVCATAERFYAVGTVLSNMVQLLQVHPSVRLLKHVVRCYLRLADHPRAREALKTCLPQSLRDNTFGPHLHNDPTVQKWLSQLLQVVGQNADGSDAASTAPTVATSLSASTLGDN